MTEVFVDSADKLLTQIDDAGLVTKFASAATAVLTASNVGTVGTGIFKQKTLTNLEFYKLNSASNLLAIALVGTDRIDFTVNANNVVAASNDSRLSDARPLLGSIAESAVTGLVTDLSTLATAVVLRELLANKGAASGYASLDGTAKIPIAQIPTGTTASTVPFGNDSRFTDARTPLAHATTHKSGGSDVIKLDELAAPTDISALNATTSLHGLLKKLSGTATEFMNGSGNWAVPTGATFTGGDVASTIRITNFATPGGGEGMELAYVPADPASYITSYSRGASLYRNIHIDALNIGLDIQGSARAYVDASGIRVGSGGYHGWAGSATANGAIDTMIYRQATGWLEQYYAANPQSYSIYGTRTDASNYERLTIKHNGSSTGIVLSSDALGAGMVARPFIFTGAKVGIGGAPTTGILHVFDTTATAIAGIYVTKTVTDSIAFNPALNFVANHSQVTSAFGGIAPGLYGQLQIGAGNTQNWNGSGGGEGSSGAVGLAGKVEGRSGWSGTVTWASAILGIHELAGGAFTNAACFRALNAVGTGAITNMFGSYCPDLTKGGTLNVGFESLVTAGTGKWAFRGSGTAASGLLGDLVMGSAVAISWGSSALATPDTFLYRGGAAGMIGYGGTTNAFPGLLRNSAVLECKLADNSAFANFKCLGLTLTAPGTLKGYTVATLPAGVIGNIAYATDLLTPTFLTTAVGGGAVVGMVFYNGSAWVNV